MIPTSLPLEQLLTHIKPSGTLEHWAQAVCNITSLLSESSLTTFYRLPKTQINRGKKVSYLYLLAQTGHTTAPERVPSNAEFLQAAVGCEGAVLQNSPGGPFPQLLMNPDMQSGIAIVLGKKAPYQGLLIANYTAAYHYTGRTIELFEQIRTLVKHSPQASGGKK